MKNLKNLHKKFCESPPRDLFSSKYLVTKGLQFFCRIVSSYEKVECKCNETFVQKNHLRAF